MIFRKLSEVAPPRASRFKPAPDDIVWHLTLDQIEPGLGRIERRVWGLASEAGSSSFAFDSGNVLYSKLRPYLNKVICPDTDGIATTELVPLRPNPSELNREYLCFYLRSPEFVSWASTQVDGAKMPRMKMKSFWAHEIPVPPLSDQIRIAFLLGKVEGLIARRKQHLQQLDDLLQSAFLEMFGDIRAKKSNHSWTALRPYLKANSGKSSKGVISNSDTGIPIFGGNGINGWATKALYETPVVVAGRVGQQCGVIHVSKGPCWVTDNAIVLSISDNSRLNIVYVAMAFHYAPIRDRVKQLDLPFINQSMLLDYPLPLPSIDLQNRFAAIVEKIENVKTHYQRSRTDLEALYGALSQQAFKGAVDLSRVPMPRERQEEEQIAEVEPLHTPSELGLAIELPDDDDLLDALGNAGTREVLISYWLEAYRGQLGKIPFSVQHFMAVAQTHMADVRPDTEFELGTKDYECIKSWIFEALAAGTLNQALDEAGNQIQLQAAQL